MHDSSVNEHSVLYQMQAYFPAPAYEREGKENHDDRQDRICTQVSHAVHYFHACVFPERTEPQRIDLSVDHIGVFLDLLAHAVDLIIALFFSGTAQPETEVLSEESIYRSQLNAVIFDEFYLFLYVRIGIFQLIFRSHCEEVTVIQVFTAFNSSLFCLITGIGIEFRKYSRLIRHYPQSFC